MRAPDTGRRRQVTIIVMLVAVFGALTIEYRLIEAATAADRPEATVGPGTRAMAQRLARLQNPDRPGRNPTVGCDLRVEAFRARREQARDLRSYLNTSLQYGYELLKCGRTFDAIETFEQVRANLERSQGRDDPQSQRIVSEFLAMCYMRLGEQDNCLAQHGPESCLLPIRGSGVHAHPRGSRAAVRELTDLLQRDSNQLAARWLLNLAYMTLDEYPERVPAAWLIPPSTFASEYDVKTFPNVAGDVGLEIRSLSGGVCIDDFDGDGHLDLVVSAWGADEQIRFMRNQGDGTFVDRTRAAGLTGEFGGLNLNHADYDNDGDPDVLVLRGAWLQEDGRHPNSLLRNNGDGTFEDVTEASGVLSFHPTQAAGWADFDNDGWVDLFIGNESTDGPRGPQTHPCELYRNNGDGTFTNVAEREGVAHVGFVKAMAWGDYDNDGLSDLYLSRMGQPNVLYRNRGAAATPRFVDVTESAGVAEPLNSFPTWFWDYDNDGWLDLFVAPFPGFGGNSLDQITADYLDQPCRAEKARLYRNMGDGTFEERSRAAGIHDAMLAMGANFGDFDNDGYLDAYIGTGEPNLRSLVPNRAYRNEGGQRFQNVTTSGGFGHLQKGHGVAFGDIDGDGDQDVYAVMGGAYASDVAYNALFRNPGHGHRWITLRLRGARSNRAAFGARIVVTVDTSKGPRRIHATVGTGGSFGSSSLQQEIGLGDATSIRSIEVTWPASGAVQRFDGAAMDAVYTVHEDRDALIAE